MKAKRIVATVVEVRDLGPNAGLVELEAKGVGLDVQPGRFAMVEAPGRPDCTLLRPYSYATVRSENRVGFLLKRVGKGTDALLNTRVGDSVVVLGPFGNSFPEAPSGSWLVSGGVGAAPFVLFSQRHELEFFFGARNGEDCEIAEAFLSEGVALEIATDDGSRGFHGRVTDLLREHLANKIPPVIFACGPTAMMKAVAQVAAEFSVPSWVSLEARMGCGYGVCRGCTHLDATGGWRCICEDGPVYASEIIFGSESSDG
jgi:dihydroorotate dehydrogenase electron transfer subunit